MQDRFIFLQRTRSNNRTWEVSYARVVGREGLRLEALSHFTILQYVPAEYGTIVLQLFDGRRDHRELRVARLDKNVEEAPHKKAATEVGLVLEKADKLTVRLIKTLRPGRDNKLMLYPS